MANQKSATRRILFIIGGLIALLVLLGIVGAAAGLFGGDGDGVEVETAQAERRDVTQTVTASGAVQPEVEVNISPDVSGEIVELNVNEGDQVQRGALLARIRPDFYAAQVEQAEAGVLQSQAGQAQAKASLLQAEIDFKRQEDLYGKGVTAESDYQTSKTQFEMQQAALEAAQYAVRSAEARRDEAREQLSKTNIYAPMDGTVSKLDVELGERVVGTSQMAGTEMMRIARLDQMEMEVDVNENDVVNVSIGDTARVEVDAYPEQPFDGVVTEIANSARVTAQGTQEQLTNFPVKIRILGVSGQDESETSEGVAREEVPGALLTAANLRPGMSGTVDIFTQTTPGAVAVPIQAVTVRDFNLVKPDSAAVEDEGEDEAARAGEEDLRKVVFLVESGEARMVEVETGIADDTHISVRSGLSGGETVIVGPYSVVSRTLEPGTAVQVEGHESQRGPIAAAN